MHTKDMIENMRLRRAEAKRLVEFLRMHQRALDDKAKAHPGAAVMAETIDALNAFLDYLESIKDEYRY